DLEPISQALPFEIGVEAIPGLAGLPGQEGIGPHVAEIDLRGQRRPDLATGELQEPRAFDRAMVEGQVPFRLDPGNELDPQGQTARLGRWGPSRADPGYEHRLLELDDRCAIGLGPDCLIEPLEPAAFHREIPPVDHQGMATNGPRAFDFEGAAFHLDAAS